MPLPDNAHVTLKELKDFAPFAGDARDDAAERAIGRASSVVDGEGLGGRRTIYRGPVEDDDSVMLSATLANGNSVPAIVGGAWSNAAGRTLVVTLVDADRNLTAGTLTVTGTVDGVGGVTETFDLTQGNVFHGLKFFTAISALALTGVAGAGQGDTLKIGTSEGYRELYSPCYGQTIIRPLEWPVRNVVQVHEDWDRVFGSASLLVAGTDYELRNAGSILRAIVRLSSGLDSTWLAGTRVAQGRMSAGYKGPAEVPWKIKGVTLELAAWFLQHSDRKQYGLQSQSDAMGSRSFSGPPMLSQGMKNELGEYFRAEVDPTAERDFVLEAVV